MLLSPGTKLGAYEIMAPLGAGGMGEVYRARDTKLGRDVALKMLPAEMAQDPERLGRFRREAKALAQLDHPNIVTIHSVEECDGIHFLTMQLVEGLPLDRLIPQGGLPVEQIVEIANALGDALAAAHEKGIVHRDLKPANVMVSNGGRVKVLDFGLAKDIRTADLSDATMTSANRTEVGMVMGTPAYMSPEQASGRPLDHRTDIFSLGVVLHEMATGQRPFEGSSSAELVSAILRDTPPPVTDVRPDLPSDMARVIRRCLEKDPRHRVQTARDVSNEFRDLAQQTSQKVATATPSASRAVAAADSGAARAHEGFWVAVLPFKYAGVNADLTVLAEGLTEDIVTGLARFSYLRVIARNSAAKYSSESGDVRTIGKELGARYVMEGSLRQAGTKLRLAVQLVDAVSGAHLWAENYERTFSSESIFALQDDLVPRIVSTVADQNGILTRTMSETLRSKNEDALTPHEAVLRAFSYYQRVTPAEHLVVRRILERAVRDAPDYADCWAMLSVMYSNEFADEFNLGPNPLDRAFAAAQRAVHFAPNHALGHYAQAYVCFFRKETVSFRAAAEKALALNPMDGSVMGILGVLITHAGESERGCQIVEAAMQINPNYPGLFRFAAFTDAYEKGKYAEALELAVRVHMPNFFYAHAARAAALGQLGHREAADREVRELLTLRPDFATEARREYSKWYDPELVEHMIDGLRKAGLEVPGQDVRRTSSPAATTGGVHTASGASRADEGFWVAVLPFKYSGGNADLTALAEGLTEDIVTGLSRFSYLRVIARNSTAKYSSESRDVRTTGKELGARYVMEGSLRQAGTKLRLAVQLVDATSGAHLWAETYFHSFNPEAIFELQDELVPRIVATVADTRGVLAQTMSEALRSRAPDQLSPYEALLRSFAYFQRIDPEEHALVRAALERAVEQAPSHANAWAILSILYREEYTHGFNLLPDPLGRAFAAARRAIEIAPSNHYGYHALASVLFFRQERQGFQNAAERAITLNPMDGFTFAYMGSLFAYSGDWARGCALSQQARNLNPHHPGWYWFAPLYDAYNKRDYRTALDIALKVNMPGFWRTHFTLAATYGQLGELESAHRAVRELLAIRPNFAATARTELEKWHYPQLVEHLIEGLRKAGLEIGEADSPKGAASR